MDKNEFKSSIEKMNKPIRTIDEQIDALTKLSKEVAKKVGIFKDIQKR